jgi:hypothetical protein
VQPLLHHVQGGDKSGNQLSKRDSSELKTRE